MRALVTADIHFKHAYKKEGEAFIKAFLAVADEHEPDVVFILGDSFDTHENIKVDCMNLMTKLLRGLVRRKIPCVLLVGNHDYVNSSQFLSSRHALASFKYWKTKTPIIVVDEPTKLSIEGLRITACPYVPAGRFAEALATIKNPYDCDLILAHQEFRGYTSETGHVVTVCNETYSEKPTVLSGHIHTQQNIGNVMYVGKPIQYTFSDPCCDAIWIVDVEKDKNAEILLNVQKFGSGLPQKVTVHVTPENYAKTLKECKSSHEYRVVVRGLPKEIHSLQKKKVKRPKNVKILYQASLTNFEDDDRPAKTVSFMEILRTQVLLHSEPVQKLFEEIVKN